jgi:solute carrier family 14 (urea transporter)
MNNPWSGVLIMAGLFMQSTWVALCGLLGVLSATAAGIIMNFDKNLIKAGILGYNGILVGLALATFRGR